MMTHIIIIVLTSLFSPKSVRRIAVIGFGVSVGLLFLTLIFGSEIKGAKRWLSILGFSLQASEFVKPCFAIFAA